jgi:hypothetical protein
VTDLPEDELRALMANLPAMWVPGDEDGAYLAKMRGRYLLAIQEHRTAGPLVLGSLWSDVFVPHYSPDPASEWQHWRLSLRLATDPELKPAPAIGQALTAWAHRLRLSDAWLVDRAIQTLRRWERITEDCAPYGWPAGLDRPLSLDKTTAHALDQGHNGEDEAAERLASAERTLAKRWSYEGITVRQSRWGNRDVIKPEGRSQLQAKEQALWRTDIDEPWVWDPLEQSEADGLAIMSAYMQRRLDQVRQEYEQQGKAASPTPGPKRGRKGGNWDEHFRWLVRRQILGETYEQIGDDRGGRWLGTVHEGVTKLAGILGVTLR